MSWTTLVEHDDMLAWCVAGLQIGLRIAHAFQPSIDFGDADLHPSRSDGFKLAVEHIGRKISRLTPVAGQPNAGWNDGERGKIGYRPLVAQSAGEARDSMNADRLQCVRQNVGFEGFTDRRSAARCFARGTSLLPDGIHTR